MKRGMEGRGPPPKRGRGPPVGAGRCAFKVLCPDSLVAAVLGPNGQAVAQVQEQSGCHCNFSRRGEFFPNSKLRVLVVSGPSPIDIMTCLDMVLDHVGSCANEERQVLEGQGKFGEEDGEFVDAAGDLRLCVAVTDFAAKGGNDGADAISRIQEETGVRLYIDETSYDNHQLIVLAGNRDQLLAGLERFNSLVQARMEEDWFPAWADLKTFGGGRDDFRPPPPHEGRSSKHRNVLFIGGLSQQTDAANLQSYFSRYGEVVEADVKRDGQTGRSKGFGFITFAEEACAESCLTDPKEHNLDGKRIDVKRYGVSERRQDAGPSFAPPSRRPHEERIRGPPEPAPGPFGRGYGGPSAGFPPERRPEGGSRKALADIKWFGGLAEAVPAQYLDLDYCITCSLPSAQCGALIGRRGENINEVERKTGAKVQLSKKEQNTDHRTLSVTGPLIAVYAAHLLLMRDYNEALQVPEVRPSPVAAESKIQELQKEIGRLKQQMGGGAYR
ncbi:unnamed protein product [Effrenium voratum]|uniref:RRM domain-containing protein n=1 Tax=Effrenium voratum TaxID=2562239 RepID=A0AA36N2D7_9DINO|nr:unnamed protein product [Effrenium voratum]